MSGLPESFEFYHLGTIESLDPAEGAGPAEGTALERESMLNECGLCPDDGIIVVSIRSLMLTSRWVLLALFPRGFAESLGSGVDSSALLELANVIASRVADDLTHSCDGQGVMLTPPEIIGRARAARLITSMEPIDWREYKHGANASVKVWILSAQEESGNV